MEGGLDGGVPEPVLDHLGVLSGLEEERRVRVAEVVGRGVPQSRLPGQPDQPSGEPVGANRGAVLPREDEPRVLRGPASGETLLDFDRRCSRKTPTVSGPRLMARRTALL